MAEALPKAAAAGDGLQNIIRAPPQRERERESRSTAIQPLWQQELPIREIQAGRTGGGFAAKYGKKIIAWDVAPGKEYFQELFRVSREQIIWGGNYFGLPPTRCFIVWRKTNIPIKGFTMAPVEYAWTSFCRNAVCIEASSAGTRKRPRFHATQKPIKLYQELLERFAKPGDRILDTHVGSASSLIACENMGFEYTGFEIDEEYYEKAKARIAEDTAQIRIKL